MCLELLDLEPEVPNVFLVLGLAAAVRVQPLVLPAKRGRLSLERLMLGVKIGTVIGRLLSSHVQRERK